jgi:hypothetical protein
MVGGFVRIISGGQTGVDRAALDAALELGLEIGGWCPKGRRSEDGTVPAKYPLKETISSFYLERTEFNVRDSDGTLILTLDGAKSPGTLQTIKIAQRRGMPLTCMEINTTPQICLIEWLNKYKIQTLNVAGPRESKFPGVYEKAKAWLIEALR